MSNGAALTNSSDASGHPETKSLPFVCPKCGSNFGWGDGSAPIFLGVVNSIPFNNEPTPCCGYKISGTINRDLEMELA